MVISGAGQERTRLQLAPGGKGRAVFDTGPSSPWTHPFVEIQGHLPRGTAVLPVPTSKGFAVGDIVWVGTVTPKGIPPESTMRRRYDWPASGVLYDNTFNGHFGRGLLARIAALNESTITLDRPLAHDLYADEPIQLRKCGLAGGIGLQDFTLVSAAGVKIDSIWWENVADSWLLRVTVRKPANWSLGYGSSFRLNCEIRDCHFDGTQAEINNGSTAYLGWSGVMTDCLMVNTRANDLRHMAIFQGAIRCVVRDCTFTGKSVTSPQFHGQFPHDNLVEGTTFDVNNGFWTVDGMSTLRHGVEGPRNVLYHSRFPSGNGAAYLFGGVEGHILAYNKIARTNARYPNSAFMAFDRTWNTVVRGNVIQADPRFPFLNLNDLSCVGWEVRGNTIHGSNGLIAQGDGSVAVNDANHRLSYDAPLGEPQPEAVSIIDWQKANADKPRLVIFPLGATLLAPGEKTTLRITRIATPLSGELTFSLDATPTGALKFPRNASIPAGKAYADIEVEAGAKEEEISIVASASGLLVDAERLEIRAPVPGDRLMADVATKPEGFPEGWRLDSFGLPASAADATWNNGTVTFRSSGKPSSGDNSFRINERAQLTRPLEGDGSITVRLSAADPEARAGILIADDVAPVTEAILLLADGQIITTGAIWEYTGNPSVARKADGSMPPVWLRLTRHGAVFTASRSTVEKPTETDWEELAKVDFYAAPPEQHKQYRSLAKLDTRMHYGLVVNGFTDSVTATFEGVSITPGK